jgi:hypothetical protein
MTKDYRIPCYIKGDKAKTLYLRKTELSNTMAYIPFDYWGEVNDHPLCFPHLCASSCLIDAQISDLTLEQRQFLFQSLLEN